MRGEVITSHKDVVSFPFKDNHIPPLPSTTLSNHRSISKTVGNPAPNIIKLVHKKKFDVRCKTGT